MARPKWWIWAALGVVAVMAVAGYVWTFPSAILGVRPLAAGTYQDPQWQYGSYMKDGQLQGRFETGDGIREITSSAHSDGHTAFLISGRTVSAQDYLTRVIRYGDDKVIYAQTVTIGDGGLLVRVEARPDNSNSAESTASP